MSVAVSEASLLIGTADRSYVTVNGASGNFEIDENGSIILEVSENDAAIFDVPGVAMVSKNIKVEINTRPVKQDKFNLPPGPYVRVASMSNTMTLGGLSLNDGSAVKMSGDIFFDKSEDQFRLAIANVTSSVEANQVQANLSQASGALIINQMELLELLTVLLMQN